MEKALYDIVVLLREKVFLNRPVHDSKLSTALNSL